jgi:hypothetical protein
MTAAALQKSEKDTGTLAGSSDPAIICRFSKPLIVFLQFSNAVGQEEVVDPHSHPNEYSEEPHWLSQKRDSFGAPRGIEPSNTGFTVRIAYLFAIT